MSSWQRLRAALFEVGLALGGMLLATVVLFVFSALGLIPTSGALGRGIAFVLGPALTLGAVVFYRLVAKRLDETDVVVPPLQPEPESDAAPGARGTAVSAVGWAVAGIVAAIVGSFALGQLLTLLGAPVEEQEGIVEIAEAAKRGEGLVTFGIFVGAATVLAPIAEELLFRGLVFRRILRRGLPAEAYALSAAAFAMIHNNPAGFVVYLWLGIVFAESLRRSGRLWVAITVHAGNNAFAIATLMLLTE